MDGRDTGVAGAVSSICGNGQILYSMEIIVLSFSFALLIQRPIHSYQIHTEDTISPTSHLPSKSPLRFSIQSIEGCAKTVSAPATSPDAFPQLRTQHEALSHPCPAHQCEKLDRAPIVIIGTKEVVSVRPHVSVSVSAVEAVPSVARILRGPTNKTSVPTGGLRSHDITQSMLHVGSRDGYDVFGGWGNVSDRFLY